MYYRGKENKQQICRADGQLIGASSAPCARTIKRGNLIYYGLRPWWPGHKICAQCLWFSHWRSQLEQEIRLDPRTRLAIFCVGALQSVCALQNRGWGYGTDSRNSDPLFFIRTVTHFAPVHPRCIYLKLKKSNNTK